MNIYLIDGNSYVYRAFYAIKGLTDSKGRPTNAVFGFTNMLLKIIRDRRPDGLAVSFDSALPTERHMLFEQYKAHRPKAPDELRQQIPLIKKVITAFNIRIFELPGYEADDILATVAEKASQAGMNVFIVTGDKDMLQLLHNSIRVYDPMKDATLDESHVMERLGVPPSRVTEFMALAGDAADNIPGIKGIGEKTARELLTEFKSLDELIAQPERIKRQRLRKLITESTDIIRLSKRLAEIDKNVPVELNTDDLLMRQPDWQCLLRLFLEFEFISLMKYIPSEATGTVSHAKKDYEVIQSLKRLKELVDSIKEEFSFALSPTMAVGAVPLMGLSICHGEGRVFYIPPEEIKKQDVLSVIKPLFENHNIAKAGHDIKHDMPLLKQAGLNIRGRLYDTMIADYLLNPLKADHSLNNLSLEHLSRKREIYPAETEGIAVKEACDNAGLILELKNALFGKLKEKGMEYAYFDIEMPLICVLSEMQEAGIKINVQRLNDLSKMLERDLEGIKKRIYFLAGEEFNINSPRQLARVLFDTMGLKPGKKKKTGYSTDMAVMEELSKTHELPAEILNWRSLYKLKATYVDALPLLVNPLTGRLHTSFNQTVTATGRLSSSGPNLQNIPIRGEWGKQIREAFIAESGNILVFADYSQIELRILAHLCQDKGLIDSFLKDIDIHSEAAAEIFNVPPDRVTEDMRRVAKTVNFGIVYGITQFGLSETLGISRQEAERYISRYFERHPLVRTYIEKTIKEAKEKGYVKTLFGRKRPVPELLSKNASIRQLGERLAVNSPIQGTAADIIKIAMNNIFKKGLCPLLQVHDELLFECPDKELNAVTEFVRNEMEGAVRLSVPLKVEIKWGKNWAGGVIDPSLTTKNIFDALLLKLE